VFKNYILINIITAINHLTAISSNALHCFHKTISSVISSIYY